MNHKVLLLRFQEAFMRALCQVRPVRGRSQVVLIAQFVCDGLVDFLHRLFFGDLKKTSACFLGDPLQYLLAIRTRLLRVPSPTRPTSASMPAHAASETSIVLMLFVREQNRI